VSDNSYVATELTQGETYYVRLRPFDLFGKTGTNTSAEFAVTTKTGVDITGLSGWAYEIDPVDRAFIENALAKDAEQKKRIPIRLSCGYQDHKKAGKARMSYQLATMS